MMKEAIVAGLISGLVSPLFLSWLQHRLIWKSQKRFEVKFNIFSEAVSALSSLEADAINPKLQSNKTEYNGTTRIVELRPETEEALEKSRGMVKAFFSDSTYKIFDKALRSKISIDNIPNSEFEKNRTNSILEMSRELGIDNQSLWQKLTNYSLGRLFRKNPTA
jgi:hypothetical protein